MTDLIKFSRIHLHTRKRRRVKPLLRVTDHLQTNNHNS